MKNTKEIIGNIVIAGSMLTAVRSAVDVALNKTFWSEVQRGQEIETQLRSQYGVEADCGRDFCVDKVRGVNSQETAAIILEQFYKERSKQLSSMPSNPATGSRVALGMTLVFGGITAAAVANRVKK